MQTRKPHSSASRNRRTAKVPAPIQQIRNAGSASCRWLTTHHLNRLMQEQLPEAFRALDHLRNGRNLLAGGRSLPQWLKAGALQGYSDWRMLPMIEGLHGLGHVELARELQCEYGEWKARCAALADACPRAMPKKRADRKRVVDQTVDAAEALLTSLITRVGHYARQAGLEIHPGAGFTEIMERLLKTGAR